MASLPYPRTPLPHVYTPPSSASRSSFPSFTPSLFLFILPTFVIRIDRRRHPHRPTQTSAPTDADARIDRRGCSYRPTRMTFVDVSQCQTVAFVLPNRCFRSAKPLLSCSQTVAFAVQDLTFHISLPLFLAISSPVFLDQRCFPVVCILWLQSLKQSLSPIII